MPKSFAEHLFKSRGSSGRPSKRLLRAAFGMEIPGDDESMREEFSDATHFDPRSRVYAEGGEVEGSRQRVLPDTRRAGSANEDEDDWNRHVTAAINDSRHRRAAQGALPDTQAAQDGNEWWAQWRDPSRRLAEGGEVERDPSDFPKKDHDLPDAEPPWYEGETAKAEHAARRAAEDDDKDEGETQAAVASRMALGGLARGRFSKGAECHASGGFAGHMARRLRIRSAMGGR